MQWSLRFWFSTAALLLFTAEVDRVTAQSSCGAFTCGSYGACQSLSSTLANGAPLDDFFVIGTTGGLATDAYNNSRVGKLAQMYISSTTVTSSSYSCSSFVDNNGVSGDLVVPPYDQDMLKIGISNGGPCYWLGGTITKNTGAIQFSGTSVAGTYSFACPSSSQNRNPIMARALSSSCDAVYVGTYSNSNPKTFAYNPCFIASTDSGLPTVSWVSRGDGFEEFYMKYLLRGTLANTFCVDMGGFLGTVRNSTHAATLYTLFGGKFWTGYSCTTSASSSCGFNDGTSSSVSVSTSTFNFADARGVITFSSSQYRYVSATPSNKWYPFFCSRPIQSIGVSFTAPKCYKTLQCPVSVSPSIMIQWYHLPDDATKISFSLSFAGTSATAISFASQETSGSTTITAHALPGSRVLTIRMLSPFGYNFPRVDTQTMTISDFETVTLTSPTTFTYFANQTFSVVASKPTAHTITLSTTALFSSATSWAGGSSLTLTGSSSVAVPSGVSVSFYASGQPFYFSPVYYGPSNSSVYRFTILAQSTVDITGSASPSSIIVDGDMVTLTATVSSAISSIGSSFTIAASVLPSGTAPLSLQSGGLTWSVGQSGAKSLTYQATNPGASATTVTVQCTYSHVQFVALTTPLPSVVFTVRPKITPSLSGTGTYTTAQSGIVTVTVPRVYVSGVVFGVACPGLSNISPSPQTLTASAVATTISFTITSSTAHTCTMSITISGSTSGYYLPGNTLAVSFSDQPVLSSSINASSIYALQGASVMVSATPTSALGANFITIGVAWTGGSGVSFLSATTVTLTQSGASATLLLRGLAADSGNVTFSVITSTAVVFPSTVAPVALTVLGLKVVTQTQTVATMQSTGLAYAQTLSFSLPSLPEGSTTINASILYNTSAFSLLPSSAFSWAGTDSSLSDAVVTVVGLNPVVASPFSVVFSGSTASVNKTILSLPSITLYVRANINASLSANVTYGTVPVTLTMQTTLAPLNYAVVIRYVLPTDFGGGEGLVTIPIGVTTASVVLTPTASSSTPGSITFSLPSASNNNTELLRFEASMLSVSVTVNPLRSASLACNASRLYLTSLSAVSCTLTVALALPNLTAVPVASSVFVVSSSSLVLSSTNSATFVVTANTGASVSDGTSMPLSFAMSDPTFVTPSLSLLVKSAIVVSISLPTLMYVGTLASPSVNAFVVTLTVSPPPDLVGITATVSITTPGLIYNTSAITLSSTTPSVQTLLCWGTTPGTYSLGYPVSGSAAFATQTVTVAAVLRPLVSLNTYTINPTFVFLGQTGQLTLSVSDVAPSGSVTVTPQYWCNGMAANSAVTVPTSVLSGSTTTASVAIGTVSSCPSGGSMALSITSTSTAVDTTPPAPLTFLILPLKTVQLAVQPVVYCGGTNTSTLTLTLSGAPNASFFCFQLASSSGLISMTQTNLNYTQGTGILVLTSTISAPSCPSVATTVQIVPSLQSSVANSEYALGTALSTLSVQVLPLLNVSLPTSLPTSTLYVGGATYFVAALPQPPDTFLTMTVSTNASLSVTLSPPAFTFTPTSGQTVNVSITATAATWIAVTVQFTGTASQYVPQRSTTWVLQFLPLGVVSSTTEQIPKSMFTSQTFAVVMQLSFLPPPPLQVFVSITSNNTAAAVAVPSQLQWNASTLAALVFTIAPLSQSGSPVFFTLSLQAPSMYSPVMNLNNFSLSVVSSRTIVWSVTAVMYVGAANALSTTLSIAVQPPSGVSLGLSPSVPGAQASSIGINSIYAFTSSSSTSQSVLIQGFAPMSNVQVSLLITSGAAFYDAPPPAFITIRALETVSVTGLPAQMYVGASVTFNVTVSRAPACSASTLSVSPTSNQLSSATFSVPSVSYSSSDTVLVRQVTVAAVAATLANSPVLITFPLGGTCTSIFQPVPSTTLSVFNLESVTMSLPPTQLDATSYFVYERNNITLTVSLGTPAIFHDTAVVVQLQYLGPGSAVTFYPSTLIFPPGINATSIQVGGVSATGSAAAIVMTVTQGAAVFATTNSLQLRVLPRIPLTVTFTQTPLLFFVQGLSTTVTLTVASTALVGTLNASFSYSGSQMTSTAVTFAPQSAALVATVVLTGQTLSSTGTLALVLSGAGAGSYAPVVASWSGVAVVPVVQTWISVASSMFVDLPNAIQATFTVDDPSDPLDQITLRFAANQFVSWGSTTTTVLNASVTTATVTLRGLLPGTVRLATLVTVSSLSNQYNTTVSGTSTVTIAARRAATVTDYSPSMFDGGNQTFTVTLPVAPLSGTLVLTPSLSTSAGGGAYANFTPATLTFTSDPNSLSQSLTVNVTGVYTGQIVLRGAGSFEYLDTLATLNLVVNSPNQTSRFGFVSSIYRGAANAFQFGISLRVPPPNSGTVTISLQGYASIATMTPSTLVFNSTSSLAQTVTVVGTSAGSATVSFLITDTSNYFEGLSATTLTVLPLETFSGTVGQTVVPVSLTTTVTLSLSSAPRAPGVTVSLVMQQPRQDNQNAYNLMTSSQFSVTPAATVILISTTSITFTITALAPGLTPLVSFSVQQNSESNRFDIATLPTFHLRFVALRTINVAAPSTLYSNLLGSALVQLSASPDAGTYVSVSASPSASSVQMEATLLTFLPGNTSFSFFATPIATGIFSVIFAVNPSPGNTAYSLVTTPSTWSFSVQAPSTLTLVGLPSQVYVETANAFYLNISGYGALSPGETLYVNLTCNTSAVSVFPPTVEVSSMTPAFLLSSSVVTTAVCNMSFLPSINRFVPDPMFSAGGQGLLISFLPLKTSTLASPSSASPFINQQVSLAVTIRSLPSAGRTLIASLVYGGSAANVQLSPPISWTSQSASTTQSLFITGLSPSSGSSVSVVLSGDSQYAPLTTQYSIQFLAFLQITVLPPLQAFVGATTSISFALDSAAVLGISFTYSIPTAMIVVDRFGTPVTPQQVQYVFGDGVSKTGYVQCRSAGAVVVSFSVSGQDASSFAAPAPVTITCFPLTTVVVNAPANNMVMYLSPSFFNTITVQVAVAPSMGTLIVTPTVTCAGSSSSTASIVTMSVSVFHFNSSMPLSQSLSMLGSTVGGPCDLSFPLTGNTTGYIGNRVFTVTVKPLINISMSAMPSVIYVGAQNQVFLTVSLDPSATIPLASPVNVSFFTSAQGTLCIAVSPTSLYWAALSNTETLSKSVTITALCDNTALQVVGTSVSAAPNIYRNNLPSGVSLTASALVGVTVTSNPPGQTNFNLYVGGASLSLSVVLGSNLLATESLTVSAQYKGVTGSVAQVTAQWLPSPTFTSTKQLVLLPLSVSPLASLQFTVVAPPRFVSVASGGGTLLVIGPVPVRATVPSPLIVGNEYTVTVTLGGSTQPGEVVVIQPVWYGDAAALSWSPRTITFNENTTGLQQTVVFRARAFQAGYRLTVVVKGSVRYATTAFDGVIVVQDAKQIISTALPSQLMRGQTYYLGIDVGELPTGSNTVTVTTMTISGPQCISFPSGSTFSFTGTNPNAPTVQLVPVQVTKIGCPTNQLPFEVLPSSDLTYSQTIPSRNFSTVAPGVVSIDWPSYAYIGEANTVTALILRVGVLASTSSTLSVLISADDFVALSTTNVTFTYDGPTSYEVTLWRNASGSVSFTFSVGTGEAIPPQSTRFLSLLNVGISASPSSNKLYTGVDNMQQLALTLDTPMQTLDNGNLKTIRIDIVPSGNNLTVQPSYVKWSPGYNRTQFVYLLANAPQAQLTVSFVLGGTGATYVRSYPSPLTLSLVNPLYVTHSSAPTTLYVGEGNAVRLNVTLPAFQASLVDIVVVSLSVAGDAASILIKPSRLVWVGGTAQPNVTQPAFFTITGIYATTTANVLLYTLSVGPPWIQMVPLGSTAVGTAVLNLQDLAMTPPDTAYSLYVGTVQTITYSPSTLLLQCRSTNGNLATVSVFPGTVHISSVMPGFSRILCTVNDTSYNTPAPIAVTTLARKVISAVPSILYTYPGISSVQPTKFQVSMNVLPSTPVVISVSSNFSTTAFRVSPDSLTIGSTSQGLLTFAVDGLTVSNGIVNVPLVVVSDKMEELDPSVLTLALRVQILPLLSVSMRCPALPALLSSTQSSPFPWYVTSSNIIEIVFSIPRATVFQPILIAPDPSANPTGLLIFCKTILGCSTSDFTTSAPAVLDQTVVAVSVFVFTNTPLSASLRFVITNAAQCNDYSGPSTLIAGYVNFQPLEEVLIDVSRLRADFDNVRDPNQYNKLLYVGVNNSQTLVVSPTGPPVGSTAAEVTMSVPGNLAVNILTQGSGFTGTNRGGGQYALQWISSSVSVHIQLIGVTPSQGYVQIFFSWRSTPANFWKSFNYVKVNVTVLPLIVFSVQAPLSAGGTATLVAGTPYAVPIFMGTQNIFQPILSTASMPVLEATTLDVAITAAPSNLLSLSTSRVSFGLYVNGGSTSVAMTLYAIYTHNTAAAQTVTVTFDVLPSSPPEFNRTSYQILFTILPLQTLISSLTTTVVTVGSDNAVTFTLTPRLPVSLVLNALVTCPEVSFTAVDSLSWSATKDPKQLRVSATSATGLSTSRCVIITQAIGGGDKNTFEQPPFNATIRSLNKPTIVAAQQDTIPVGAAVATNGYNISIALPSSFYSWNTQYSLNQLLRNGGLKITSSRSADEEPASFAALLNAQLAGGQTFVTMRIDPAANAMTLQFGPLATFQPTTLETVTVTVGRLALTQGVSLDANAASVTFQVQGSKKQLFGNTGGFIGQGTSAASIIGALVSVAAAQQANRLQTIQNAFVCPNEDWRQQQDNFQWNDELIPISFGSDDDLGGFTAAGFTNMMLVLAVGVLHLGVGWAAYEYRKSGSFADKTFAGALAWVRFPSFMLVPAMFVYQNVVSQSLTVIMYSPRLLFRMIAAFTFVAGGMGLPVATYTIIGPGFRAKYITEADLERHQEEIRRRTNLRTIFGHEAPDTATAEAVNLEDNDDNDDNAHERPSAEDKAVDRAASPREAPAPAKRSMSGFAYFMSYFKPTGTWKYEDDPYWLQRYELFFGEFRGGRHWYLAMDLFLTFCLGVCDGMQPVNTTQCLARTSAYVFLFVVQFLSIVILRPYSSTFANLFFVVAYFLQAFSMIFVAVAVFQNNSTWGGVAAAVNALVLFGTALYVKTFLDFLQSLNEKFELEKFFDERKDLNVKVLSGKKVEELVTRNFEREITEKYIEKQEEKQFANIGYLVRGPPAHEGRSYEQIERELNREHREKEGYDPRRYLAKFRGPQGGDADSEEEEILRRHERTAAELRPKVTLLERHERGASHYYDPVDGRVKITKRLDERFERMLQAAKEREAAAAASAASNHIPNGPFSGSPRGGSQTAEGPLSHARGATSLLGSLREHRASDSASSPAQPSVASLVRTRSGSQTSSSASPAAVAGRPRSNSGTRRDSRVVDRDDLL